MGAAQEKAHSIPEKQVVNTMLKEYLLSQNPGTGRWSRSMPGVQICRFSLSEPEPLRPIPVRGAPLQFEAFFCLSGRLVVRPLQGASCTVQAPGIFLLSDSSELRSCLCSGDMSGILAAVDAASARESLQTICSILGIELDTRRVKEKMAASSGCMVLFGTPWTQAFFETMQYLPREAQEQYCVFKSVELLYLLCSETPAPNEAAIGAARPVFPCMSEVKAYIQTHLAEKLTIGFLCKQFSVSPTFLKEGFRRAYGMPIHSFLIQQRLQHARKLIRTTGMPIQKIAQSVGYESASQFNAAFRRHFGITPGQYRKMS